MSGSFNATGNLAPAAKLALVDREATKDGTEIFLPFPSDMVDEYAACARRSHKELGAEIRAMGRTPRDKRVMNTLIGNPYMVNAFVTGSDDNFTPGLSLVSTADAAVEEGEDDDGAAAASGVAPGFNVLGAVAATVPSADADEQS